MSEKLVPVKLVQNYRHLNAGEVAGFPQAEADDILQRGIAAPYTGDAASGPDTVGSIETDDDDGDSKKSGRRKS